MLGHHRVTPSIMSAVTTYTPRWREAKWSKVPCLRKQRDGRGLNPRPQDPEFEVLTARPHMPPSLPDNNYTNRDPVSLAGPVNTRELRNFAPKFEFRNSEIQNSGIMQGWGKIDLVPESKWRKIYPSFRGKGSLSYPVQESGRRHIPI